MKIRPFDSSDQKAVVELWDRCGLLRPWNDPHKDIARKQLVQPELFLVGVINQKMVAAVMAGYDGHRGWINYLAVDPDNGRQGLGRTLMATVEQRLRDRGCSKINLQIRQDNLSAIEFYERIGFTQDAVISLGKRLECDR